MKRLKYLILFFFFSILTFTLSAQTQGCLIGGVLYNKSTYVVIPDLGCGWQTPRASAPSGWTGFEPLACTVLGGVAGGFNPRPVTSCPLDDYIWLMILPLGGLGFYYMRRRFLQQLQVL